MTFSPMEKSRTSLIFLSLITLVQLSINPTAVAQQSPLSSLPEFQSMYPVSTPTYDNVEQLLVLSDRWIVVVTSTQREIIDAIDSLASGVVKPAIAKWDTAVAANGRDWSAQKVFQDARNKYIAKARIMAGENILDSTSAYGLKSANDSRYATTRRPRQVGRTLVGLGRGELTGGPEIDYVHYSYLELPIPLANGKTYTVTVRGGKSVTFLFDANRTVSRAIKVNQVGYLSDAPRKFAYLGCHLYEVGPMDCSPYTKFELVNAKTGAVAFTGTPRLRDADGRISPLVNDPNSTTPGQEITGENVYELDFTGLTQTGQFFIRIPGVGRSWPFYHGPDAFGEAFYTAARGMYHQRCGIELGEPFTAWPRIRCHAGTTYESDLIAFPKNLLEQPTNYLRFDVVGATLDTSRKTYGQTGGWHDAADWDRNNNHYTNVFDLLYAFELAPSKFSDNQLNIPESGNGIPDILDEAAYGLMVWKRSMNSAGGVSGFVEANTHPFLTSDVPFAYAQRTRWDSLLFAAAAAQLAELLKPYDYVDSNRWAWYARRAYEYGNSAAGSLGKTVTHAKTNRGTGDPYTVTWEEKDEHLLPYLLHARIRLYRITKQRTYLKDIEALADSVRRPYSWPFTMFDYSPWLFYDLVSEPGILSEAKRAKLIKTHYTDHADALVSFLESMPYRCTWRRDQNFWMGFGASDLTNAGRALLIAHRLTGKAKYRDAAILNFDFMLGANPMGMSWTTGLGYTYPINIQHEVSDTDGIADPVPGITIYGVNGGMYRDLKTKVWSSPGGVLSKDPIDFKVPEVPLWRTWSCHPTLNVQQCEFTIHETMSSTIFCSALLLSDNWKPSSQLVNRAPRPKEALHGLYYLP